MFFILSAEKPFEKCPRNNGFATISESLALILIISVLLTNKQLFSPLQYKLKQNFFIVTVKLVEYFFQQSMLYHLIFMHGLHQELKYLFSYY